MQRNVRGSGRAGSRSAPWGVGGALLACLIGCSEDAPGPVDTAPPAPVSSPVPGGAAGSGAQPAPAGPQAGGGATQPGGLAVMGVGLDQVGAAPTLPPVQDYAGPGPFTAIQVESTGPDGMYTMFRPEEMGHNGFRHPIATWGNGIFTIPDNYHMLLKQVATHGFVIIASNSRMVTPVLMRTGLDWLIEQNGAGGEFEGQLDPDRAVSIGYSLGGRGAVGAGAHPNVIATVSMHGLTGPAEGLHGPLLLFAGEVDDVVGPGLVQATFDRSSAVPTFYTTRMGAGHYWPAGDAKDERPALIAWLRLWVYDDEGARPYFYGEDCILCMDPWLNHQRKNWD